MAVGCRTQVVRAAVGVVGAGQPKATTSPWKLPNRTVVPVRASDGATLSGLLAANPLVGPLLVRGSMGAKAPTEDVRQIGVVFAATATAARRGFLRSIQAMDLSDAGTSIDLPVLVAVGSLDRLTSPGLSRRQCTGPGRAGLGGAGGHEQQRWHSGPDGSAKS